MNRRTLGLLVLGALLALACASVVIGVATDATGQRMDATFAALLIAGLWCYWGLGVLIVRQGDGHRIGWLFATAAVLLGAVFGSWAAVSTLSTIPGTDGLAGWFVLLGALLFPPATILIFPAVAMVFPTGSLPGPRWRWVVRVIAALVVVGSLAVIALPYPLDGDKPNPFGAWFTWLQWDSLAFLTNAGTVAIVLAMVAGVVAMGSRFVRARGVERQQLKWVFAVVIPAAVLIPLSLVDGIPAPIGLASIVPLPLMPLAITAAVLRYRLYDIDRIISRTLGWAIVTGLLIGVFAAGVVALQAALDGVTQGQTLAVAASTLVAFALFQPLRRRVQRAVDRRFDRARYDAERTAAAFSDRLRDEVDIEAVTADLRATVEGSMRPMSAGVWLAGRTGR